MARAATCAAAPGPSLSAVGADDQPARRHHRVSIALFAFISCSFLGASLCWPRQPVLIWNLTDSAPRGPYLRSSGAVRRGDMVAARIPLRFESFAAGRHYIPSSIPLIKKVAASPGDLVCAAGRSILIDGTPIAIRRDVDGAGRPLPAWSGCRRLHHDELFLLMADKPDSFDGRYFGISVQSDIIARVTLLWHG